jgi:predicted phosphodiesterase
LSELWYTADRPAGSRTGIFGDIHVPYQDKHGLRIAIEVMAEAGCDTVILQGDTTDYYPLSRYEKDPAIEALLGTMRKEAEATKKLVDELSLHFDEIIVGAGNHEGKRWHEFTTKNPAFAGTPWDYPLEGAYKGCRVLPWKYHLQMGDLVVCHGDRLFPKGLPPKDATGSVLAKYPTQNTLFGHTHRVQQTIHTLYANGRARQYAAWTIGKLYDPTIQDYDPDPRHQDGFAIIDHFSDNKFVVTQHLILATGKTGKGRKCHSPLTRKDHR